MSFWTRKDICPIGQEKIYVLEEEKKIFMFLRTRTYIYSLGQESCMSMRTYKMACPLGQENINVLEDKKENCP